jgi:hypothetical protein
MHKIHKLRPEYLRITSPPSTYTITAAIDMYPPVLLQEGRVPPIFVVCWTFDSFLILDGHHRAYLLARRLLPISAFVLTRESDRDEILRLETHTEVPRFSHRDYLMGTVSLLQLGQQAIEQARYWGMRSITDLVATDIDKIGSLKPAKAPYSLGANYPACIRMTDSDMQPPKCGFLVVYDGKTRRLIPILPHKLKEARKAGYELVMEADTQKVRDDVLWATENWERIDKDVRAIITVLPNTGW